MAASSTVAGFSKPVLKVGEVVEHEDNLWEVWSFSKWDDGVCLLRCDSSQEPHFVCVPHFACVPLGQDGNGDGEGR